VNQNLTERIQKAINDTQEKGEGLAEFSKVWKEITPWVQSYADTVYRTNCNTSYTNGRFAQAEDDDVKEVIPAMQYISMHLPTSRPNHEAAHGLIATSDDPIWNRYRPPMGYKQCGINFRG
jgi:SPP1 gp7 family putative phage head morphogenesis protein